MENFWIRPAFLLVCASLVWAGRAHAYDDLGKPPPLPVGSAQPAKPTEASVAHDVEQQIAQRFASAAGGSSNLLSQQQAKSAGWGFVSDHFSEIDRNGSGYVSLNDVLRFTAQRSPQNIMRMKAAASAGAGR